MDISIGRFGILDVLSNGEAVGLCPGCDADAELAVRPRLGLTADDVAQIKALAQNTWTPVVISAYQAEAAEPVKTLAQSRVAAHLTIDAQAGATRRKYITDATGQDATYLQKAADATAYIAAGYPSAAIAAYPMVRAEARAIYGSSPSAIQYQLAADYIIATQTAFAQKGADIEEARRGGKIAVSNAQTVADAQAAQAAAIAALVAL